MHQKILNYKTMTANRSVITHGGAYTSQRSSSPIATGVTVRSMRLRMKDKLDFTEKGRQLKRHIMNEISLDELLPVMMEVFPRHEYHKINHTLDKRGMVKAVESLLDAVFRYDGGLMKFHEALDKSGHANTRDFYKHLFRKCREEYKQDVARGEQERRLNEERRKRERASRRSRSEDIFRRNEDLVRRRESDTMNTVRSDPSINATNVPDSIVEISLGNNERSRAQNNTTRNQPDFRTRNNRVFFD